MRYAEISAPFAYAAMVLINAMDESRIRDAIDADPALMLTECVSTRPGRRAVYVACTSHEAASRFESRWDVSFDDNFFDD